MCPILESTQEVPSWRVFSVGSKCTSSAIDCQESRGAFLYRSMAMFPLWVCSSSTRIPFPGYGPLSPVSGSGTVKNFWELRFLSYLQNIILLYFPPSWQAMRPLNWDNWSSDSGVAGSVTPSHWVRIYWREASEHRPRGLLEIGVSPPKLKSSKCRKVSHYELAMGEKVQLLPQREIGSLS